MDKSSFLFDFDRMTHANNQACEVVPEYLDNQRDLASDGLDKSSECKPPLLLKSRELGCIR